MNSRKDAYLVSFFKFRLIFNKSCILAFVSFLFLSSLFAFISISSFSPVGDSQNVWSNEALAIENTSKNNTLPIAQDMNVTNVGKSEPVTFLLKGSDLDGDKLNYTIIVDPAVGDIERFDPPSGTLTYKAGIYYGSGDSFAYKVTDSKGHDSNIAIVNLRSQK